MNDIWNGRFENNELNLLTFLKGRDEEAQNRLNDLFQAIGIKPNILWYPSAGNDYRDVIELSQERARQHKIAVLPDLMIHTDYRANRNFVGIQYEDSRTALEIVNSCELELIQDIYYDRISDGGRSGLVATKPLIHLLDIQVTSETAGTFNKSILYFHFENINFLDQVILKNKLRISHIVKVREGAKWGDNVREEIIAGRISISVVYAFVPLLNTEYILKDSEEVRMNMVVIERLIIIHKLWRDFRFSEQMKHHLHSFRPLGISLSKTRWSGFQVVVIKNGNLYW